MCHPSVPVRRTSKNSGGPVWPPLSTSSRPSSTGSEADALQSGAPGTVSDTIVNVVMPSSETTRPEVSPPATHILCGRVSFRISARRRPKRRPNSVPRSLGSYPSSSARARVQARFGSWGPNAVNKTTLFPDRNARLASSITRSIVLLEATSSMRSAQSIAIVTHPASRAHWICRAVFEAALAERTRT